MPYIGILGGTFDPIHLGHLRSAEEIREACGFDRVLFIPAASPPHKQVNQLASPEHRLAMVRLAIAGNACFRASAIELERHGHSYSIDTLRLLRNRHRQARFAFILGIDAFREIGTWREWRALFAECDIIVTSRPSRGTGRRQTWTAQRLRRMLPVAAQKDFCYSPEKKVLVHCSGHHVAFQQISDLDISSTAIRQRLQRGQSVRYLIAQSVEKYITRHHLYTRRAAAQ